MNDTRIEALTELPADTAQAVLDLIEEAAAEDGQPAVSEQGRLHVRRGARQGVRHLLMWASGGHGGVHSAAELADDGDEILVGYAQIDGTDPVEAPAAELVVHPGAPLARTRQGTRRGAARRDRQAAAGVGARRPPRRPPPRRCSSASSSSASCARCAGR